MKDENLPKGRVWPLGASCHDGGVNFALFSSGARSVTLCVFDTDGRETHRYAMNGPVNNVWHGFLPNAGTGLIYGYRVDGPYDPSRGLRYNPARLLLDPYARRLHGQFQWHESHLDRPDTQMDDNAAYMPKAVVTGVHEFDWEGDRRPNIPMCESVIYEAHVKGFTQSHPDVPAELRGTYEGLASPAAIAHLKRLGVTAVELLPVQESISEGTLIEMGLCNYWGYNTLAFFAPDRRFARQDPVNEFRQMVKELHRNGIEVILDVVYNHTPEGDQRGPTLSWRGLDNQAYYHLSRQDPAYYANYTGTGNSVNASNYVALQMIMDSLRYWVQEMHVDGFRFDLASTLARQFAEVDRLSAFFDLIHQDPIVSQVKLIAEPWDVGADGYQVGGFPPLWSEWNGRYRDTVRDFWRGEFSSLPGFASRLAGSSDLYGTTGRKPMASINFVVAHDGFTLRDLVSYNEKHNEANGEGGADGANDNRSWNCGTEGNTDDKDIIELRYRQQRNFLTTLMFSQGVPMIAHGDELGRTQRGNNNAYCQDNELSWIDWDLDKHDHKLLQFTRDLIHLRRDHPVMRRRRFLEGPAKRGGESELGEIEWFTPAGTHMTEEEWNQPWARSTMVFYNGDAIREPDADGRRILDDDFLLLINAAPEAVDFTLPDAKYGSLWHTVVDTAGDDDHRDYRSGDTVHVRPHTAFILRNPRGL